MSKTTITFGEIMLRLSAPGSERLFQSPELVANSAEEKPTLPYLSPASACLSPLSPFCRNRIQSQRLRSPTCASIVSISSPHCPRPRADGNLLSRAGANQRPSKVVYDRQGSSIAIAGRDSIDWERTFAGAGWLHVTGITPALSEGAAAMTPEAVKRARAAA